MTAPDPTLTAEFDHAGFAAADIIESGLEDGLLRLAPDQASLCCSHDHPFQC